MIKIIYTFILNIFLKINFKTIKSVIVKIIMLPMYGNIGSKSTILNHQFKYVKPIINNPTMINVNINLYGDTSNFDFSLFLDLDKVNKSDKPEIPVAITHSEEYAYSGIILNFTKNAITKMLIIVVRAVGIAFEIIFFKKLPCILSLLGSKASINEGIPIVTTLIKLKWIGSNG